MNSDQADILDLLSGHTDDSTIERLAFECLMNGIADESDGRFAGRPQVRTRFRR